MKRYLKLSIIRKLPLYVVLSVLLLTVAFSNATSVEFEVDRYFDYTPSPDSAISGLIIFFVLIMTILPFFSMNYRYSLARSDLYRQVAFKDNKIRIGEHLASLIILSISFTIAFIALVSVLMFRNYGPVTRNPAFYLYYQWYIPLYFAVLLIGAGQYFISYLFISRGNTFINSLLMLVTGTIFLNFFVCVFASYISSEISTGSYYAFGPTFIGYSYYLTRIFGDLICDNCVHMFDASMYSDESAVHAIIAFFSLLIQFAAVTTLGIIALIKEKDPSSEYAGKPDSDKPYQEIVFHAGFAVLGLVIGTLMMESLLSLIYGFLYFTTYVVAYYTLYGLLHRNFKLKGRQAAVLFGIAGFDILFSYAYVIIKAMVIAAMYSNQ